MMSAMHPAGAPLWALPPLPLARTHAKAVWIASPLLRLITLIDKLETLGWLLGINSTARPCVNAKGLWVGVQQGGSGAKEQREAAEQETGRAQRSYLRRRVVLYSYT